MGDMKLWMIYGLLFLVFLFAGMCVCVYKYSFSPYISRLLLFDYKLRGTFAVCRQWTERRKVGGMAFCFISSRTNPDLYVFVLLTIFSR
jgi:hypothetical protein